MTVMGPAHGTPEEKTTDRQPRFHPAESVQIAHERVGRTAAARPGAGHEGRPS